MANADGFTDDGREWIAAREALRLVSERNGAEGAQETILRRLTAGLLASRARLLRGLAPEGGTASEPEFHFVDLSAFWSRERPEKIVADWGSGDFSVPGGSGYQWQAFGAELDQYEINLLAPVPGGTGRTEQSQPGVGKGRKPAHWWPDFAEELAMYVHEHGLPPGTGVEGQGDVIKAVLGRLADQGKEEPTRSAIQSVINAVLRRTRAAGN
jgi:hypothetical protein